MVAPCAGAWVEIRDGLIDQLEYEGSLPVRERGLKLGLLQCAVGLGGASLPVRERGLK